MFGEKQRIRMMNLETDLVNVKDENRKLRRDINLLCDYFDLEIVPVFDFSFYPPTYTVQRKKPQMELVDGKWRIKEEKK